MGLRILMIVMSSDGNQKEELYVKRENVWRKLKDFS